MVDLLLFPKESTVSVSDISHCKFVLLGKCKRYESEMEIKGSEERNLYYKVNTKYHHIVKSVIDLSISTDENYHSTGLSMLYSVLGTKKRTLQAIVVRDKNLVGCLGFSDRKFERFGLCY
jgi:hypothetical protein